MNEGQKERGGNGAAALVFAAVVLVILLPILYVLSTGPVMWLCVNDYVSQEAVATFYSPLAFLCEHCDPLHRFVIWWQDCFLPRDPKAGAHGLA